MSSRRTISLQELRPGLKIDVQDQEGDWFETLVRKVVGNKIVCHFWGFANIWDCTIEFDASKLAPVHTFSEKCKYKDNEKLLGECVWEILSLRNMLNEKKQCAADSYQVIQRETGISRQQMQSFLDTMDAPDAIQLKLCKWVQKYVIEMQLDLRIQELLENGADCFGTEPQIRRNMETIQAMQLKKQINLKPMPPPILSLPRLPPLDFDTTQTPLISLHEQSSILPSIASTATCTTSMSSSTHIQPLDLANLDKIVLPELPELPDILKPNHSHFDSSSHSNTTDSDPSCITQPPALAVPSQSVSSYLSPTTANIMDSKAAYLLLNAASNSKLKAQNNEHSKKRKQSQLSCKPKKKRRKNEDTLLGADAISKVLVTKYDHNAVKKGWMDIPTKDELQPAADGMYRCPSSECQKKPPFKTYTSTCRHIQIEHQGYRYRCDFCREEYSTEVEFRSHSTLKIHLQNMHKLSKPDFSRIRIVLSLVGNDSIVKKTASSDEDAFCEWKRYIVDNDKKRNGKGKKKLLHVTKKSRCLLKKLPVFGLTINGGVNHKDDIDVEHEHEEEEGHGDDEAEEEDESMDEDDANMNGSKSGSMPLAMVNIANIGLPMEVDIDLNGTANVNVTATSSVNNHKDKAFMDRIDQLIQNLETDPKKDKRHRKPICDICGQNFKNFQALGGHKKKHNPDWKRSLRRKRRKQREADEDDDELHSCDETDFDSENEKDDEFDEDLDIMTKCARNYSDKREKHESDDEEDIDLSANKNMSTNVTHTTFDMKSLPHIPVFVQPPPPPPRREETETEIVSSNLKLSPFGPLNIKGLSMNGVFQECENKSWAENMQGKVSKYHGSTIMHLADR